MKRSANLICLAVLGCGATFGGTISLSPTSTSVPLGTPVTINVDVAGIADLYAFQFDVDFDPAIFSATTVTEGSLFSSAGVFFSPGIIDNTAGTVTFIGDSLSGPGPGISADGTLATVLFNSIGVGVGNLTLANIILLDSALDDVSGTTQDASVTVTGSAMTPEPSSVMLVLPAVVILFAYRKVGRNAAGRDRRDSRENARSSSAHQHVMLTPAREMPRAASEDR